MELTFDGGEAAGLAVGWEIRSIGMIGPLQRGFDLPHSVRSDGPYPVVYSNGIINFHAKAMVKGPGVVTGRSGTLGNVHFVDSDYWPHNTSLWVTKFNGSVPRFIYYLYTYIGFDRFASGSGVPTLNRNDAHSFEVAIPVDPVEQLAIATALSDVDALLAAQDALIAKKRAIKQGAMQELLTGKRRLPGFGGEWQVRRLGEVFKISVGTSKADYIVENGDSWICDMGSVSVDGALIVSKQTNFSDDYLVRGDLIMPKDDIGGGKIIGRVGFIDACQKYVLSDHVYLLRAQEGDPKFLSYCINSDQVNKSLRKSVVGSAQLGLGRKSVMRQEIAFPPIKEQLAISEVLSDMDTEIASLEAQRAKTAQLKQGMMHALLTGRIRLV